MLGLHNYHDTFNHFPPGTMPNAALKPEECLSWLAALQPYLDQAALYNQMDQNGAWNKGKNEAISQTVHPFYLHPSVSNPDPGTTHYVGLGGLAPTVRRSMRRIQRLELLRMKSADRCETSSTALRIRSLLPNRMPAIAGCREARRR